MPEVRVPADHARESRHRLLLHPRTRAAPVERVVVGIDEHGERVREARHGVRGFQHLPHVERMLIGEVVVHSPGRLEQGRTDACRVRALAGGGQTSETRRERVDGFLEETGFA